MPRQARLDAPGAVHHVIARGVARGKIFADELDRTCFLKEFGALLAASESNCLAWCLMPNHFHLLVRTGEKPLTWVMQRLLLRHAQKFNRHWNRAGHLFQNRYKAILIEEDAYLTAVIRYIHLNPLKAGMVDTLRQLANYPWCGHGALLGERTVEWQDVDGGLGAFGGSRSEARQRYVSWMAEGVTTRKTGEYSGGGLLRALGGPESAGRAVRSRERIEGDERILGGGEFVARVHREQEAMDRRRRGEAPRLKPMEVVEQAAQAFAVTGRDVLSRTRRRSVSQARAVTCSWMVEELGMNLAPVARLLNISSPAVVQAMARGRALVAARRLKLKQRER